MKTSSKYADVLKLSDDDKKTIDNKFVVESAQHNLAGKILAQKKAISDAERERANYLQGKDLDFGRLAAMDEEYAALQSGLKTLEGFQTELF